MPSFFENPTLDLTHTVNTVLPAATPNHGRKPFENTGVQNEPPPSGRKPPRTPTSAIIEPQAGRRPEARFLTTRQLHFGRPCEGVRPGGCLTIEYFHGGGGNASRNPLILKRFQAIAQIGTHGRPVR